MAILVLRAPLAAASSSRLRRFCDREAAPRRGAWRGEGMPLKQHRGVIFVEQARFEEQTGDQERQLGSLVQKHTRLLV